MDSVWEIPDPSACDSDHVHHGSHRPKHPRRVPAATLKRAGGARIAVECHCLICDLWIETRWEEDAAGEPGGPEPSDSQTLERQLGGGRSAGSAERQGTGDGSFIRSELMRLDSRKIHLRGRLELLKDWGRGAIRTGARGSAVVLAFMCSCQSHVHL